MPDYTNDPIYKKSNAVVSRSLRPETLVIPIQAGSANLNEVYLLNETAGRIWSLLDGQHTTSQIIAIIIQEYAVSAEDAQADYEQLVSELEERAVLTRLPSYTKS